MRRPGEATLRYRWSLFGVVALGFAVRLAYTLGPARQVHLAGDSQFFFRPVAENIANLHGFTLLANGAYVGTANHPPLFSLLLAAFDLVGLHSIHAQQIALAVFGSLGLVAVAEVGRHLRGGLVGVIAALIAALDPLWITHDAALLSESLVLVLVPIVLLCALRCLESPSRWRWAAVGASLGLLLLTRTDCVVLAGVLVAVMVLIIEVPWRQRVGGVACLALAGAVLVLPWSIRNHAAAGTWSLSLNAGTTVAGANCDKTYSTPELLGGFTLICSYGSAYRAQSHLGRKLSTAELDSAMTHLGYRYLRQHSSRVPAVVLARERRTWGLYPISDQMLLAHQEGRSLTWERRGLQISYGVIALFAVGVLMALRRRRRYDLILLAPIINITLVSALVYGSTRMRSAGQPAIVVLAALPIAWAVNRLRTRTPTPG